jgi:hypothetical protein
MTWRGGDDRPAVDQGLRQPGGCPRRTSRPRRKSPGLAALQQKDFSHRCGFCVASTALLYGLVLLLAYAVGHCSIIVLAGTSTGLVRRYLNWNEKSKGAVILKKICGVLVLLAGLYLIYIAKSGPGAAGKAT